MKKLILSALTLIAFTAFTFGQGKSTEKKDTKKEAKAATTTKKEVKKEEKKEAKSGTPTKKDGTPDMRYKENKNKTNHVKHMKKDGAPDKRFKENKKEKTKG